MADLEFHIKTTSDETGVKKLNETNQELIHNLKVLRHEHIPGLTSALHLLRHPVVAVGVAVGSVIEIFKKWDEKVRESVQRSAEIAGLIKPINDFRAVAIDAATRAKEFATQLGRIAEEGRHAADEIKNIVEFEKALNKANDEKRSAQEKLAVAQLKVRAAADPSYTKGQLERDTAAVQAHYAKVQQEDTKQRARREESLRGFAVTQNEILTFQAQKEKDDADQKLAALEREKTVRVELEKQFAGVSEKDIGEKKKRAEELRGALTSPVSALGRGVREIAGQAGIALPYNRQAVESGMEEELRGIDQQIAAFEAYSKTRETRGKQSEADQKLAADAAKAAAEKVVELTKKNLELSRILSEARAQRLATEPVSDQAAALAEETRQVELEGELIKIRRETREKIQGYQREITQGLKEGKDVSEPRRQLQEAYRLIQDTLSTSPTFSMPQVSPARGAPTAFTPGLSAAQLGAARLGDKAINDAASAMTSLPSLVSAIISAVEEIQKRVKSSQMDH